MAENDDSLTTHAESLSRLNALVDLAARLNQPCDAGQLLQIITGQAAVLLQAEHAFLLLLNPRTRETLRTVHRISARTADPVLREIERNTSGWIMCYDQSLLSEDLRHDERFKGLKLQEGPYRTVIGIPLRHENILVGALVLINQKSGVRFSRLELLLLEKLGHIVSPFLRNTQDLQGFFIKPLPEAVLLEKYAKLGLLGRSEKFIGLLKGIEAAARCDVRVLLQGASGTGKELIARAIHMMSERWNGPFVAIDCGAIPAALMESELMGYVRGAFTGAHSDRKGLIGEADHGTLFMDEVVNLPAELQAKLLRVLQEGEIRPIGSNHSQKVDVRVIAAASSSLERQVELGQFRQDLYYRLYVFPITVPSLDERREDIGLLADHFLVKTAARQHKKAGALSPEILEFLKRRSWPGNVRELENMIERLVTLVPAESIEINRSLLPGDLWHELAGRERQKDGEMPVLSYAERMDDYEALIIRQALEENGWSQSRAARALRMPVQTLHNKMIRLKVEIPPNRRHQSD